jgi:hypothetical protein
MGSVADEFCLPPPPDPNPDLNKFYANFLLENVVVEICYTKHKA